MTLISEALNGKGVCAVFCDKSEAIDMTWHLIQLHKLSSIDIYGPVTWLFFLYLSDRKQIHIVVLATSTYDISDIPQIAIIGPLFFLIYTNDILNATQANIRLSSDDISLSIIVEDVVVFGNILNHDISRIMNWSKAWLVRFNPSTTEYIIFSRTRSTPIHHQLYIDGNPSQVSHTS